MVLAFCVIEVRINIQGDDVTTWSNVLGGEMWPAVRDGAYEQWESTGEVMLGSDKKKFPGAPDKVWQRSIQLSKANKKKKNKGFLMSCMLELQMAVCVK